MQFDSKICTRSASDDDDDDDDDLPPMIGRLNMIRSHSPMNTAKNLYWIAK